MAGRGWLRGEASLFGRLVLRRDITVAVLSAVAMALNFAWFDVPGHGGACIARDMVLHEACIDGHTCFLIGMFVASSLAFLAPAWFERYRAPVVGACAVVGTVALALQFAPVSVELSAVAACVTGFVNIPVLMVEVLLLTTIVDRKVAGAAVAGTFVLRGALVYVSDVCLDARGQMVFLMALPLLCALCTGVAMRAAHVRGTVACEPGLVFAKPLSTAMVGLLVLSSVAFAVACAVGSTGFWGTPFALTGSGWVMLVVGSAVFFAVTYITLVKTEASLLFRFMPGLLVLFVVYSFLYLGTGTQLGFSASVLLAVGHFAEYYGEAFSWFVLLLAVRTLAMPPFRVVGLSFCVNAAMTIVFQYLLLLDGNSGLVIVQMGFFAMFAVLVWALYHFHGIGNQLREVCLVEETPQGGAEELASVHEDTGGHLRSMAVAHGLSERETDVFLLLAHGHSRRYICDQLFIADGTASTHIGRIYEKMGVSSKQELLSLVQGDAESSLRRVPDSQSVQ